MVLQLSENCLRLHDEEQLGNDGGKPGEQHTERRRCVKVASGQAVEGFNA